MPYLADNAYLAIKPESAAGTAVIPTVFVPLVSESIKTVVNHTPDKRIKGIDWASTGMLRGFRSHEGEIVILGDADTVGHFLNMVLAKSSTTGDATDGYTHTFAVGTPDTYTIEIKKGNHVVRYFGVSVDELKLDFVDGQLQVTASIKAMGQFSVATLGVTTSGAVTSITLDDEYDIAPNRGLVVGDKLDVDGVEVTLTSVNANGVAVGFTSTTVGKSAGVRVFLKPQTVSLATLQEPLRLGNALVGFGADESAATTAAGSRSTATAVYDLSVTFRNNLFVTNGSNRLDPVLITPRSREAELMLKQLFATVEQRTKFLERGKQGVTMVVLGKFIKSDFSTQEKLTIKFHDARQTDHGYALNVGDLIMDEQNFAALYDSSDAKAVSVELVNRTAGTAY